MPVLLLAEHDDSELSEQTSRALSAALQIDAVVDILVVGTAPAPIAASAATLVGVRRVLQLGGDAFEGMPAEAVADGILTCADGYDTFVAVASSVGKSVMPRVAAMLDVMQVSDVIGVDGPRIFRRPIYAGNAVQTVEALDAKSVLTVRASSFAPTPGGGSAEIEALDHAVPAPLSRFVENLTINQERPSLGAARVVVSGGRALGSQDKFMELLLPLADRLGAAIGASRAAVDAGYAPNDWQVGQTGKIVAPDLYIAIGISGAIQHLAGMKDAKVIVAINKDADAPIFSIADYGLVGDLFTILPELDAALAAVGAGK